MGIDVKEWLTKDMGFSAEEAAELAGKFDGRVDRLEKGQMRLSDYSRAMDEVRTKDAKLTSEIAEWASIRDRGGDNGDAQKRIDELERSQFELQQTVKRKATELGIPVEDLIPTESQMPERKEERQPVDTSQFINREQFGTVSALLLSLPADLIEISREHEQLTGKQLNTREITAEIQRRATTGKGDVNPFRVWEEMHNIPTVRASKQEADIQARIASEVEAGLTRRMSELNLPGVATGRGGNSPILHRPNSGSHIERPQPGSRMQSAIDSLRSGKYRETANT